MREVECRNHEWWVEGGEQEELSREVILQKIDWAEKGGKKCNVIQISRHVEKNRPISS